MQIDKQEIVKLLRERGDHEQAQQAEAKLPDQVDHEQHSNVLQELGVNPAELLGKLRG